MTLVMTLAKDPGECSKSAL